MDLVEETLGGSYMLDQVQPGASPEGQGSSHDGALIDGAWYQAGAPTSGQHAQQRPHRLHVDIPASAFGIILALMRERKMVKRGQRAQ